MILCLKSGDRVWNGESDLSIRKTFQLDTTRAIKNIWNCMKRFDFHDIIHGQGDDDRFWKKAFIDLAERANGSKMHK